jgi:hypothetical protein
VIVPACCVPLAAAGTDPYPPGGVVPPEVPPPLLLPLLLQAARAVTPAVTTAVAVPALIFPKLITYLPDLDMPISWSFWVSQKWA